MLSSPLGSHDGSRFVSGPVLIGAEGATEGRAGGETCRDADCWVATEEP